MDAHFQQLGRDIEFLRQVLSGVDFTRSKWDQPRYDGRRNELVSIECRLLREWRKQFRELVVLSFENSVEGLEVFGKDATWLGEELDGSHLL